MSASPEILVTGGAGFIGSAIVWALNRRGIENILICDRLHSDEKWRNLVALNYADYLDADDLLPAAETGSQILKNIGKVFHLGACSATTERDTAFLMRNNYEYTRRLAHWALSRSARFVYASSAATYGDGAQGMDDRMEDLPSLRPLNMYGYSKHLFDLYARRMGLLNRIAGLKYFNVFGPNENHKGDMRSVVNKAFHQIRETGKMSLFKSCRPEYRDGHQRRDFLYVKDAVEITLFLADCPSATGLFNVGSGVASTWVALAEAIFAAMKREPAIEYVEMPESLRPKYQYHTCADIGRLREAGFDSELTPLAEAVADYVCHYLTTGRTLGE